MPNLVRNCHLGSPSAEQHHRLLIVLGVGSNGEAKGVDAGARDHSDAMHEDSLRES
jgi:hypothetical protein